MQAQSLCMKKSHKYWRFFSFEMFPKKSFSVVGYKFNAAINLEHNKPHNILYTKGCLTTCCQQFFSHFLTQQAHKDGNEKGSSKLRKQSVWRDMLQMHWLGCRLAKIWDCCWQLLAMIDGSSILLQDAAYLCSKRLAETQVAELP